jgi:hypothetical protein
LFQKISIYDVSSNFFETFSSNVFLIICFSKKFFTLMMFKFLCLFFSQISLKSLHQNSFFSKAFFS